MASTTERSAAPRQIRLLKPTLYVVLLATIGVLTFYISSRLAVPHHAADSPDFRLVQYGDIPRPFKLTVTSREVINIPTQGRYSLVQYISAESSRTEQAILYAQYLSRSRPSDLNYIVVVNPSAKKLATNISQLAIPNIQVSVDKGHRYVQSMGLPVDADSAIAIDGAGIVRFSTLGLVVPDALRILYSRYSGEPDDKSVDAPMPPYRIGEQIPPFQVRDIRSDRLVSSLSLISSAQRPLWIFTADCAMCSLPVYLKKLSEASASDPIPIFSSRVPIPLLTSYVHDSGYKGPLYVAIEEIPIFEDLYHNKSLTPYAAIVNVATDGRLLEVTLQSPFD